MLRKLILFPLAVFVIATTHARALGLGDITLESALNQPLAARIELSQAAGLQADDIDVRMASASDFERFSLERPYFLDSVEFEVEILADGQYIRVSSNEPVREPYLSFVIDTRWPQGRVLTEYTVLLDPPAFAGEAAQDPQPPASTVSGSAAGDGASGQVADASGSAGDAPAAPGDTGAFNSANGDTVAVNDADTLWDIALRVRPDDSVSVQQTMLAIQELNPNAFLSGNINLIRRDAVLRIPDLEDIRQLSDNEAFNEVGRQNQVFIDGDMLSASQPLGTPRADTAAPADGELSVVSVDEDSDAAPQAADAAAGELAEANERIAELENRLAVQQEELDRVERENEELAGRLEMLEEQIASAQEIIRLRDQELAQLQESLAADGGGEGAAPAAEAPGPTQVTMASDISAVDRALRAVMSNSLLMGVLLALIVALLVLVLLGRNKAKQVELAAEQRAEEDDDLDFTAGRNQAAAGFAGAGMASAAALDAGSAERDSDERESPAEGRQDWSADRGDWSEEQDDWSEELAEENSEVSEEKLEADLRAFREQGEQALVSEELDELLAEADALVAHGQLEDAQAMLQDAIVADPNRQELRVKLLEVLVEQQDVEGFRLQEAELGVPKTAVLQSRLQDLKTRVAHLEDGPEVDDNTIEWSFDEEAPALEESRPGAGEEPVEQPGRDGDKRDEDEEIEFDFTLDDFELDAGDSSAGEDKDSAATADSESRYGANVGLSWESGDAQGSDIGELSLEIEQDGAGGMEEDSSAGSDDDELELLSGSDEASTKLDLARAYIEMGDSDGAREILAEVMEEGTGSQVQDARQLLGRLD